MFELGTQDFLVRLATRERHNTVFLYNNRCRNVLLVVLLLFHVTPNRSRNASFATNVRAAAGPEFNALIKQPR